jgi:hypothetical protein
VTAAAHHVDGTDLGLALDRLQRQVEPLEYFLIAGLRERMHHVGLKGNGKRQGLELVENRFEVERDDLQLPVARRMNVAGRLAGGDQIHRDDQRCASREGKRDQAGLSA